MKSISYGCLIYIFLTINHGSPSDSPPEKNSAPTSTKCSSTAVVIKESKYLKDCKNLTFNNEDWSDDLTFSNRIPNLCRGINETLKRICELQKNLAITEKEFDTKMKNLVPSTKNDTFCDMMHNMLTSSSYNKTITSSSTPKVNKYLKSLTPVCHTMCWNSNSKSSSPLCNVLLWANQLLVDIATNNVEGSTDQKNPTTPAGSQNTNHKSDGNVKSNDNGPPSEQISDKSVVSKQEDTKPKDVNESAVLGDDSDAGKANGNPPQTSVVGPVSGSNNLSGAKVAQNSEGGGDFENGGESTSNKKDVMTASPSSGVQLRRDNPVPKAMGNQNVQQSVENDPASQVIHESNNNGADFEKVDNSPTGNGEVKSPPLEATSSEDTAESPLNQEGIPDGQNEAVKQQNIVPQENISAHPGPPDPPQHFFAYFMAVSFICLVCYIGYHKKHKIMAIIFEGRKSRGGRGRRRPNTAGYRKLDCNLEEAVTSQCNSNVTHVIY